VAGHPPRLVSGGKNRQELLAELGERAGENHAGPELAESRNRRRWGLSNRNCGAADGQGAIDTVAQRDKRKVRIALRCAGRRP